MKQATTSPALRAEITIGLETRDGQPIGRSAIVQYVADWQTQAHQTRESHIPFRVSETTLVYTGRAEQSLVLSTDRNTRYGNELSNDQWKDLVKQIAGQLAMEFNQDRIYVSYVDLDAVVILHNN